VSPTPDSYNGGVNILGHAGHVTIGTDSAGAGQQAIVDVYMHNDLDIFEYFHQILFENAAADVDSIVASRGILHYGFYPTHVSGDTIFVHGWAGSGSCFYDDPAWPGQVLYRIYFTMAAGLPPGYTMPLLFRTDDPTWNHWVGCDLTTTDSFEKTDGWVHVPVATGIDTGHPAPAAIRFGAIAPNPASRGAVASYYLSEQGRVEVDIYDAAGRKIRILQRGSRIRGWHDAGWDGADETGKPVPSGVYFYRLRSGSEMVSRKIVVIR
jgi:hypothetical protein